MMATASSSGCCPPTPSACCAGGRPGLPWPSARRPCPARRRSGRSWPRSTASGRSWPRSSAACSTPRCAPKKPSPCAAIISSSRPAAAARSSSPPPAPAPAPPRPAPAPRSSRGVSSTAPAAPSASFPSRRSWYACSASTCRRSGPRRTGGCSAAPAAACSASRSTGRAWHAARQAALGPGLAATALARRPYDLRHAALSLWLNAAAAPVEVAVRAGASARVLHEVYLHCTDGQDDAVSQRIEAALDADASVTPSSRCGKASGYAHRRHHPRPCPLYVREPVPGPAHSPRPAGLASPQHRMRTPAATSVPAGQMASETISAEARRRPDRPAHSPRNTADGFRNLSFCTQSR
jgi:hypothetical protein